MNVASLELCKELHELSGWDANEVAGFNIATGTPLYDLGYLVRKLPVKTHTVLLETGEWRCFVYGWAGCIATTPEDAACLLAIELFKSGVLGKDT